MFKLMNPKQANEIFFLVFFFFVSRIAWFDLALLIQVYSFALFQRFYLILILFLVVTLKFLIPQFLFFFSFFIFVKFLLRLIYVHIKS